MTVFDRYRIKLEKNKQDNKMMKQKNYKKYLEKVKRKQVRKIIDWQPYTVLVPNVGINNEQYESINNYKPIFESEVK